jgi:hypothetical protein
MKKRKIQCWLANKRYHQGQQAKKIKTITPKKTSFDLLKSVFDKNRNPSKLMVKCLIILTNYNKAKILYWFRLRRFNYNQKSAELELRPPPQPPFLQDTGLRQRSAFLRIKKYCKNPACLNPTHSGKGWDSAHFKACKRNNPTPPSPPFNSGVFSRSV